MTQIFLCKEKKKNGIFAVSGGYFRPAESICFVTVQSHEESKPPVEKEPKEK